MISPKILAKRFHVFTRKVVRCLPKKKNVTAKVLWSELDENLLGEIMSRLGPTGQARFHAVCKRWHSVRPITTYKSLPWIVSIAMDYRGKRGSSTFKCILYEPYSSPTIPILTYKISISKLGIPRFSSYVWYTAELRHNCLFISVCQSNRSGTIYRTYFFIFSPLTRKFTRLPQLLDYEFTEFSTFILTASTNPISPDCVFLISNTCDEPEFVVMTCRKGDKEWTVRKFHNLIRGFSRAECIFGTFFLASFSGQLVSYNDINGQFEIENQDGDDNFDQLSHSEMDFLMFELNGDLTILYIGFSHYHARVDNNTFPPIPCIKRFDRLTKAWISLRSLGNQTLVVGHRIIDSIVKVGMQQARDIGLLSNVIYYYDDLGCIIYSFENGDLVQFKYNPASENSVKSGDLLQLQYNSAIRDKNHFHFFVEPPAI